MQNMTFEFGKPSFRAMALAIVVVTQFGCVIAPIAATVTAIDIVTDRRTVGNYVDDNAVEVKIRRAIRNTPGLRQQIHISVTSMNGIVLLSGETPTPALRDRIVKQAQAFSEVRQIVNEIRIAGKTSWPSRANDSWITTKVKTRLFSRTKMKANRVKVVTEQGNVYLMGIVSRTEGDTAANAARTVKGVSKVVKVFEYNS
jgi:osmotically-inducible protein OsmY